MERIFRTDNGTYDMIWHGQPLKNLKWYSDMVCLGRSYHFNFLKAVFHKFYLIHSWIHWLIYKIDDIILSIVQSLMIVKPIFKIGSLNLFSAKTTSRYREILKFPGLWMSGEFDSRRVTSNEIRTKTSNIAKILEVFFVTLTEKSSVITNDTQGPRKYHITGNRCRDTLPYATWH